MAASEKAYIAAIYSLFGGLAMHLSSPFEFSFGCLCVDACVKFSKLDLVNTSEILEVLTAFLPAVRDALSSSAQVRNRPFFVNEKKKRKNDDGLGRVGDD
jgi:hypothetical protein